MPPLSGKSGAAHPGRAESHARLPGNRLQIIRHHLDRQQAASQCQLDFGGLADFQCPAQPGPFGGIDRLPFGAMLKPPPQLRTPGHDQRAGPHVVMMHRIAEDPARFPQRCQPFLPVGVRHRHSHPVSQLINVNCTSVPVQFPQPCLPRQMTAFTFRLSVPMAEHESRVLLPCPQQPQHKGTDSAARRHLQVAAHRPGIRR
jgi:hypothetical protein